MVPAWTFTLKDLLHAANNHQWRDVDGYKTMKSGKQGNHNIYAATVTQRAYGVWSMRQRLDTLFGGDLAAAVRALVSESGCGQSELEQAMKVLEEKYLEAEEYDLYDPYG